jgi:predicted GH43/DUF377 family glycosyl hydrolase
MRGALFGLLLVLTGCSTRYAEFTLPDPGQPKAVRWEWSANLEPVLRRGSWSPYDAKDALNPSVVMHHGVLLNVYSGFDGRTWHTLTSPRFGMMSPDPDTWEGDYIAANGSALEDGPSLLYWYQAGGHTPRIGMVRDWRKRTEPVLELGPRGAWDERGVADPYVIREGDWLYMYFLGQDRARRQRLGVARSRDGINWQKLRANPILEIGPDGAFDENGLGEPAVWKSHGSWWMLYTGRDRREHRRMGLARSQDGVRWERVPAPVISGEQEWDDKVVCDPAVMVNGDMVRVWFGGGNVARPDENLNGQIGYGELKAVAH